MEVVVRQALFPFLISQICLIFSSCGYVQFAFHTSRVLEVDLRQATFLPSRFHCPVPRLWGRSYFIPQAYQIQSQIGVWAEHLDLTPDNHYVGPGHIIIYSKPLVKPFTCHETSCFHMLWKWTTPWSGNVSFQKSVEYQLQDNTNTNSEAMTLTFAKNPCVYKL